MEIKTKQLKQLIRNEILSVIKEQYDYNPEDPKWHKFRPNFTYDDGSYVFVGSIPEKMQFGKFFLAIPPDSEAGISLPGVIKGYGPTGYSLPILVRGKEFRSQFDVGFPDDYSLFANYGRPSEFDYIDIDKKYIEPMVMQS